ncbi:MAG: hypothetical protein FWH24_06560, partial [Oscillospiraceae bacterium]|nr:hypothetical protein [Oscillospiraceae bacterium]
TYEKCGIIKKDGALVLYPLNPPQVTEIAKKTAIEKNCAFIVPDLKYLKILGENIYGTHFEYKNKNYSLPFAGEHQVYNALTVIEAAKYLYSEKKIRSDHKAVYAGMEKTRFPARFEILSREPLVIFDGAHNVPAVCALRETIKKLLPDKKIILICGILKDKEPENIIKNIAGEDFTECFYAVPVNLPRAETPENLCVIAKKYCTNTAAYNNSGEALEQAVKKAEAGNFAVVCFGSLYLAGDIKHFRHRF